MYIYGNSSLKNMSHIYLAPVYVIFNTIIILNIINIINII